jgi:thiamine-phosphate pyrophosphorylase
MYSYAITDPKYYGDTPKSLKESIKALLSTKDIDYLCFRDKTTKNYEDMAKAFILTCKAHNFSKILLHGDVELSYKLNVFGVHLSSSQLHLILKAKEYGLFCVVSTHNEEEIYKALEFGADAVTYSPIFYTPDKGNPKGLEDLNEKVAKINIKIIALGGIVSDEDIAKIKTTDAYAFASIRYFIK